MSHVGQKLLLGNGFSRSSPSDGLHRVRSSITGHLDGLGPRALVEVIGQAYDRLAAAPLWSLSETETLQHLRDLNRWLERTMRRGWPQSARWRRGARQSPLAPRRPRPGWPASCSSVRRRHTATSASRVDWPSAMRRKGRRSFDLGRGARLPPPWLRRLVLVRDDNQCATPGCGAIPRQCHHIVHWADDGPTDLDNLVSLCGRCHRLIHGAHSPWTIIPVTTGRPVFTRNGPAP